MGDLAEFWKEKRLAYKEKCSKRNDKYEPMLVAIGAVKKSEAVYEFGDYFCYPTKGFAMHKKSYKKKNLDKFLEGK